MTVAANVKGIAKVFVNPELIASVVIMNFVITLPLGKTFATAHIRRSRSSSQWAICSTW